MLRAVPCRNMTSIAAWRTCRRCWHEARDLPTTALDSPGGGFASGAASGPEGTVDLRDVLAASADRRGRGTGAEGDCSPAQGRAHSQQKDARRLRFLVSAVAFRAPVARTG